MCQGENVEAGVERLWGGDPSPFTWLECEARAALAALAARLGIQLAITWYGTEHVIGSLRVPNLCLMLSLWLGMDRSIAIIRKTRR
jgi:hypothetical protein